MSMSQKDYVSIAEVIASARKDTSPDNMGGINLVTSRLSKVMAEDNPRFDAKKFYTACREG